jgi:putative ABC transport system permease protein
VRNMTTWQEVRYAVRQLRKNPGFSAVAIVTLALGISVNATMFSLVSAFLLHRPPGQEPERVAVVSSINPGGDFHADANPVSAANYLAWRESNHVFTDMAASDEYRTVSLGGGQGGQPVALHAAAVTPNYFSVLGVAPQWGRAFAEGEDQAGRDRVAILSHELWERRFAADQSVIGRTIRLNRENYTVIGVMPESFRFLGFTSQLWIPLTLTDADRTEAARADRSLRVFGRMKPAVTIEQTRAEFVALGQHAENDFPKTEKGWGVTARTLPEFIIYDLGVRNGLLVMMTAVGFVLMIACTNVAGLLLARAAGRQREVSLRLSLGASRWCIVRQLLTEGLVMALLGCGAGLVLANWGIRFLQAHLTFNEAISAVKLSLDGNVLAFAVGVSLLSAVLCSLAPALKVSRTDLNTTLKDEGRGTPGGRTRNRLRHILVTAEIAFALFLLVGTGLLIRGVFLIEHQNLGFQAEHLLTAGITLDEARYKDPSQQELFLQDLIPQLRNLPGVNAVAASSDLPSTGPGSVTLQIKGQPELPANERLSALDVVVTSEYLRASGIPLLQGRSFTETDNDTAPKVVLVNQEFVHRNLKDQDVLGKQIRLDLATGATDWGEIIGVVGDVKSFSEETRTDPEVYEAFLQRPVGSFSLMLRTTSDPNGLASALRNTVANLDSELPLDSLMSMPAVLERQKAGNPFFTGVLGVFAVLALILAAIGIYGLIAYSVGQRTHEIGIRMALGAKRSDVLWMILWEGLKLSSIGAAVGLTMALPLPKVFEAIFYGLRAKELNDLRLYFLVPVAIFVVAALAVYVPARRATRVDPMVALRYE